MTNSDTNPDIALEAPRRSRGFVLGLSTALVALGAAGAGAVVTYSRSLPDATRIAPGVQIADVGVGGLTREEELEKARQHFLMELRRNPGDTETLLDLGELLLEMEHHEEAGEKFRRAIEK